MQSGNMLIVVLIFIFIEYKRYFKRKKEAKHKNLKAIAESDLNFATYDNFIPRIIAARANGNLSEIKSCGLNVLYAGFCGPLLLIVCVTLFVSHTAYQLGSFGKNLAQFDTDYITVEYQFNNQVQKVEGTFEYIKIETISSLEIIKIHFTAYLQIKYMYRPNKKIPSKNSYSLPAATLRHEE